MKHELRQRIIVELARLTDLESTEIDRLLERPKRPEHGDLAFPCFLLAKTWGAPPPQCAIRVVQEFQPPPGIDSASALGPFVNFRFARAAFVRDTVNRALDGTLVAGDGQPKSVVLEYSSPNIAKPFHVGHLRATLIGNSLDKIYRAVGHKLVSVNHLGDWGTQFGYVWSGCEIWGRPANPSVMELVELYRRATQLKSDQEAAANGERALPHEAQGYPDVNGMAREFFLALEEGKPEAKAFWEWCLEISLRYLRQTYTRLNVAFDHYTGESFYFPMLDGIRSELEKKGLLKESMGALGVELGADPETGEELGFARVYTPDGRSLYLMRDIAAAMYRAETFKFDRSLYVVGAPQTLHFKQLKGILDRLGEPYVSKIEHVAFGHVLGMKTRGGGEFIELNDFLDEAKRRALTAYREQVSKRPEGLDEENVAEAVALSAIVFSSLSKGRLKDVHFSWETALQFQGDSGPYLLYAYARINGIREKANASGVQEVTQVSGAHVGDEHAFALASTIADLPAVLEKTLAESEPSELAAYGLELARVFSRAYNELTVVGESAEVANERLALFRATGVALRTVIELLGMTPVERM